VRPQATLCYLAGLVAALLATGHAHAAVRIGGVDASGYPVIQATVVGSAATSRPPALSANGAPVAGLSAQNLGRQKVVVLALDRSRSMAGRPFADAVAATRVFVALKGRADQVGLVAFGHRALSLSGFSGGTADAFAALGAVAVDGRSGTALYDAVVLAADRLGAQELPGRAIVVVTDGHDVSSAASLEEAIAAARRAHAGVYPIAVSGPGFDAAPLVELAHSTGGGYHTVGSTARLARVYAALAGELARTWQVRFTTPARPGESLALRASLPGLGAAETTTVLAGGGAPAAGHGLPAPLQGAAGTVALGGAVALLVALACWLVAASGDGTRLRTRLEAHVAPAVAGAKRRRPATRTGLVRQVVRATESTLGDLRQFKSLQRLLERADLPIRASEFLLIQLGAGIAFGVLFALSGASVPVTLAAMALAGLTPRIFAAFRAKARLRAFENQLPDLLITIAASLKAGHSFRQGIQTIVEEGRPPASDEFKRVLTETSLGRPMDDALKDMAERVGSKNLEFVITAITIQRQVGGSLAGLFDMVAEAVRQRQQFARKIRGLTAMGRMSAYTLVGLPLFLLVVLSVMNPTYMAPLYHTTRGHELIVIGVVSMTIGSALLRKIVSFRG
jgi:tight adherence protein B